MKARLAVTDGCGKVLGRVSEETRTGEALYSGFTVGVSKRETQGLSTPRFLPQAEANAPVEMTTLD